ncbi:MAG TPA: TRAP transporter TatT component family protein [Vicinamibacterales bacterium]|nr:TRAP transporter TatT component family protein [Vicinamibacterales bacterium]
MYISLAGAQTPGNPDALYADRVHLESARQAASIWADALAHNPRSYDAAWKLSRADYWLGGHAPESERRALLDKGIDAGRTAAAIEPNRPEGHFWMAANMGALAESYGLRQGIKYRRPIKEELEAVLRIDPSFEHGSADRALGRWYYKVPRLFGGSRQQAEQHLETSLRFDPDGTASHFFLAELYLDEDRKADARRELQKVIDARGYPEWKPEDDEFKDRARTLLASLR